CDSTRSYLLFAAPPTPSTSTLSLHDALPISPLVGPGQLFPPLVDLIDVEVELDIEVFEQMEQEQRNVGIGPGGDVRDRRGLCRRSEEHTSELQSRFDLVCRLLLEKKRVPGSL